MKTTWLQRFVWWLMGTPACSNGHAFRETHGDERNHRGARWVCRNCPAKSDGPIVDLTDRLPTSLWWGACLDCGKHAINALPTTCYAKFLECPDCGKMRMVRTAPAA